MAVAGQVGELVAEVLVGADSDGLAAGGVVERWAQVVPLARRWTSVAPAYSTAHRPGGAADQEFTGGVVEVVGGLAVLGESGELALLGPSESPGAPSRRGVWRCSRSRRRCRSSRGRRSRPWWWCRSGSGADRSWCSSRWSGCHRRPCAWFRWCAGRPRCRCSWSSTGPGRTGCWCCGHRSTSAELGVQASVRRRWPS